MPQSVLYWTSESILRDNINKNNSMLPGTIIGAEAWMPHTFVRREPRSRCFRPWEHCGCRGSVPACRTAMVRRAQVPRWKSRKQAAQVASSRTATPFPAVHIEASAALGLGEEELKGLCREEWRGWLSMSGKQYLETGESQAWGDSRVRDQFVLVGPLNVTKLRYTEEWK